MVGQNRGDLAVASAAAAAASTAAAAASAGGGGGGPQQPAPAPPPSFDPLAALDSIPYTSHLAYPAHVSSTLPPPQPWSPPLIADDDRAPDEFLAVRSLRPGPLAYPAWMRYRRQDANDIFWTDRLSRCTMDVPRFERRWTVFSTLWYLCQQWRFRGFPPTFRYLIFLAVRAARRALYDAHKRLVLWQCRLEAVLAARAVERRRRRWEADKGAAEAEAGDEGQEREGAAVAAAAYEPLPHGPRPGASFSRLMALRRLHWRNSPVAELLYLQNVAITGRVHQLPPRMQRKSRPTLFWLF